MRNRIVLAAIAALSYGTVHAGTVAYYRFEEGPTGGALTGTNGDNGLPHTTTADSAAGNNNPLRTFNVAPGFDTSPRYSAGVPAATVTNTGAVNNFSMDFAPNQDLYTEVAGTLNPQIFTTFTVEASFRPEIVGGPYQNIVGKDGKPSSGPEAPFQLKVRGDSGNLQVELIDSTNVRHDVQSSAPLAANQWYHAAAVSNGTTLSLYLDRFDGAGYQLQGAPLPIAGGISPIDSTWTVGRGMFNGGVGDWFDGQIDEVRISDSALSPSQFLFAPVPEPASMALVAAALPALVRRRRD